MKRTYQRVQILDYSDLTEDQQESAIDQCEERAMEGKYVIWTAEKNPETKEVLPLEKFMRIDPSRDPSKRTSMFDGSYGLSYFSAYFLKINRTGEEATLVYAHW